MRLRLQPRSPCSVSPAGEVTLTQRLTTRFTTQLDFLRFPFDRQRFTMKLASFYADDSELSLRLLTDRPRVEPEARLPEWKVTGFTLALAAAPAVLLMMVFAALFYFS